MVIVSVELPGYGMSDLELNPDGEASEVWIVREGVTYWKSEKIECLGTALEDAKKIGPDAHVWYWGCWWRLSAAKVYNPSIYIKKSGVLYIANGRDLLAAVEGYNLSMRGVPEDDTPVFNCLGEVDFFD